MSQAPDADRLHQLCQTVLAIGSDLDLEAMLRRITRGAASLVEARYAALGVLDPLGTRLAEFITVGLDREQVAAIGDLPEGHGILGLLIDEAEPLRLEDLRTHPSSYGFPPGHPEMHSFLGVPVRVRDEVFGNLYLAEKTTGGPFTAADQELVVSLAAAAGMAIEHARLLSRVRALGQAEDRERIARDLHDTVIQRLFATGLSLQATLPLIGREPDAAVGRVEAAVSELDLTVQEIRTAIFGLEASRPGNDGLRAKVLDLVGEACDPLGFEPRVLFDGPVDASVPDEVVPEVLAVLREALANVVRHAAATTAEVELAAGDELVVRVVDDGIGPAGVAARTGDGVTNMAERAERCGGTCTVGTAPGGRGTEVVWRAPLR